MIVRPLPQLLPSPAPSAAGRKAAPPRRGRAARRALAWGVAAVALAQLAFATAVETALPLLRDPEFGYHQLRATDLQAAHPDRPLVLVLGTSRAQNAVDPAAMGFADAPGSPLVFNGGLSGSRPVHLPLNLRRFRGAGVRPAAVLVELFPATLMVPGPPDYLFAEAEHRLTATEVRHLEPYLGDPAAFWFTWAASRANALHVFRTGVVGSVAPKWQRVRSTDYPWPTLDRVGFVPYPYDEVPAEHRERRRATMEKHYAGAVHDLRVSPLSDRAYRDLVADCRAAGVPVAFFLAPESPVFRSWYSPAGRAALAAFTRVLSDELGCPVFDAPTDYAEEDFADGHHMLPPAARRFSRDLADRHLRPWLAAVQALAGERR